ncbi:MAG TPA: ATP-binding cassette domain-containing protein [Candidatus Limnocylindrales bacterium]
MISFDRVTVTYDGASQPAIRDVTLEIGEGELCLVAGPTGSGKTTFLRTINGLVPHFTGGTLSGRVTVAGRDPRDHPPRELADLVGFVAQDPAHGFVTDTVEEELAYAMEQLAVPPPVMRTRVEETLDLLGIADLRGRPLRDLSGGQQQRVAIGSVLTAGPRILVLDEPTSALDPTAAEEVLAAILRLVHDLGMTVVLAEHRLERAVQYADRLIQLTADGAARFGDPGALLADGDIVPPVVELGRLAGWTPLPLSIRDARSRAGGIRDRLGPPPAARAGIAGGTALAASGISVRYGATVALRDVTLELRAGEVAVLMGRNGSGKSSLLWALRGVGRRSAGRVLVDGVDPAAVDDDGARRMVGLVPQTPGDLLYLDSVAAECERSDLDATASAGTTRTLLDQLHDGIRPGAHPRDLSEGQRLALVLAIQLAAAPSVVLLDEPTRGLDYPTKRRFAAVLRDLAQHGHAVLVATHDVEMAAAVADRVLVLAAGELVADGSPTEVLSASPALAPQVAKVIGPGWLTIDQVREALLSSTAPGAAR